MKHLLCKSVLMHSIIIIFFSLCLFYAVPVSANPPSNVLLEYDSSSQALKVTITHPSSATDTHFVKTVIIRKNGYVLSTNEYDSQPEPDTFSYVYDAPSEEDGDTFEVTAICSVYGEKTAIISIRR